MYPRLTPAVVGALMLVASPAAAQYIGSSNSNSAREIAYSPQGAFNEQPLVTNQQDFSIFVGPLASPKFGTNEEAGLHVIHLPGIQFGGLADSDGGQFATFLQAGAAYGITRGLEAGLFTPPLLVSPESGSGDLPLFVTWAASIDDVDYGLRTTLTIPFDSDSYIRLNPGLHILARFGGGRLDLGAFFPISFVGEDATFASLEVPVRAAFKVVDSLFVGIESGVRKLDLVGGEDDIFVPLGGYLVYSLEAGEHRIDFTGRFNWQSFLWASAPEEWPDRVLEDTYTLSFGANILLDTKGSGTRKKKEEKPEPTPAEPEQPTGVQGRPPS